MPIVRRVAYLGPENSFTHIACTRISPSFGCTPSPTIAEAVAQAEKALADAALVPLENSINGPVPETLDVLADTMLHISLVAEMPILLVVAGNPRSNRIYGHPHALAEARSWIRSRKGLEEVPVKSTSEAARRAREENALCVCSRQAAQSQGLDILEEDVGPPDNVTRFALLTWKDEPEGADRTYIASILPDTPGSLYRYLEPFARESVNLTMIYSRPSRGKPWKYVFYIEMEGSRSDENVQRALKNARGLSLMQKLLGSYPVKKL